MVHGVVALHHFLIPARSARPSSEAVYLMTLLHARCTTLYTIYNKKARPAIALRNAPFHITFLDYFATERTSAYAFSSFARSSLP